MIELLLASYEDSLRGVLAKVLCCLGRGSRPEAHDLYHVAGQKDIGINRDVLYNRMYAFAPTGISFRQLEELLFNRATRSSRRNPYEEKAYRGPRYNEVQAKWEQSKRWMAYYEHYCVPMVVDVSGIVLEFRSKDIRMLCH